MRYDIGSGEKRSSRYRTKKTYIGVKDDVFGKSLKSVDINPKSLKERLELLLQEQKLKTDDVYLMKC